MRPAGCISLEHAVLAAVPIYEVCVGQSFVLPAVLAIGGVIDHAALTFSASEFPLPLDRYKQSEIIKTQCSLGILA